MLINARPRFVFTAIEALVPTQRAELLHQKLIDMTNNEINAWGMFRPIATSTDDWDNLNDFNSDNFPLNSLYSGDYQNTASAHQPQSTNMPKVISSNTEVAESQLLSYGRSATLQQTYDEPIAEMSCLENPSPMLGNGYSQWSLGRRNGSFAEFSNAQNRTRNYSYQSNGADLVSFGSSSSLAQPQTPYQNLLGTSIGDLVQIDKMSPSTVYNSYSSPNTSIDSRSLAYLPPNAYEISTKNTWWPEHSPHNKDQCQGLYGMLASQDGLPRVHNQQQQQGWNGLWNPGRGSTNSWTLAQSGSVTVSPKALTLNVPPAPMSSSGSSQGRALSLSDSNSGSSSGDEHSDFSGPETLLVVKPSQPIRRPRQLLPDSVPGQQRRVPVLPSNGPARSPRKRLLKPRSDSNAGRESPQLRSSTISKVKQISSKSIEPTRQNVRAPNGPGPEPTAASFKEPRTESSQESQGLQHREARDDYLVRSKLAGMSYKDIRRQGNFTEAESTLRGRFRTLTKHKTARVRKPEWCENDVRLLKRAVRKLTHSPEPSKSKVPWKQVAEYIADNGGSYHFGNATCRKRWDELQLQGQS